MHRKLKQLILVTALAAVSSLALAEDPPARVARVSVVEGQVTVQESDGEEAGGNLLNWPVTSGSRITAAPGARTEFRVGSTAVRLDGDSSMEVIELDDNVLRLRLDYGTASVRLRNPEQAAGFELETPQGRVTMSEPGWVRVDAERTPDTSVVTMLAGAGRVDGAGTSMAVRGGRSVELRGDDVRTGVAQRGSFDDWVQNRDRRDESSQSLRYVTADVTGYEELDANGTWREDPEYGPLWAPRAVAVDWAPYRNGRWTWLDPWGWTWVDDAPWGYAPSHYGRWVFVQSRWYWAPGRAVVRPVWAPALVGWVGGNNWNVTFRDRAGPGVGWYPLTPRDHYVPNYRVSVEHERRLEWQHAGRVQWKEREVRNDGRRDGVTVLPREYFERRSIVNVGREPRVTLAPNDVRKAPLITAPPAAPVQVNRPGRVIETRRDDWREHRNDGQRPVAGQPMQGQPQRVMPGQQGQSLVQPGAAQDDRRRFDRAGDVERERRGDERGRISQPQAGQVQTLQTQPPQQGAAPGTFGRNPQQDAQRQAQQREERQEQFRQTQQRDEQQRQEQFRQDRQRQDLQRQDQQRQDQQHQAQQEQQRQEQFRQERQRQDLQRQDQQRQALQAQQAQQAQQQEQQRQAQQAQQREAQQREAQQREAQQRQEQQRQMQQEQQRQEQQRQMQQEQQRREQRESMRQERQQAQPQPQPQRQEAGGRPQPQPQPAAERRQQREEKDERRKGKEER